jgi:hypothetical protein
MSSVGLAVLWRPVRNDDVMRRTNDGEAPSRDGSVAARMSDSSLVDRPMTSSRMSGVDSTAQHTHVYTLTPLSLLNYISTTTTHIPLFEATTPNTHASA